MKQKAEIIVAYYVCKFINICKTIRNGIICLTTGANLIKS